MRQVRVTVTVSF